MDIATAFREGGWGMWPTLLFGTLTLALAIRHAVGPTSRLLPLILGTGTATLLSGLLGMSMGIVNTLKYIQNVPPQRQMPIMFVGLAESWQNLVLALILGVAAALLSGAAEYRQRASAPAARLLP